MRRTAALTVVAVLASSLAGTGIAMADSTTTSTSPSATVATRIAPLTGLADPADVTSRRSALTIKIDNTPQAQPQYGVQDADDVYEEVVEGGITRLAAIFNSRVPAMVGPVRSVRRTDREIVFPIGGIFAFSGGAEYALKSIATAPVKLYDEDNAGAAMFRDASRPAPHNLFANAALLMKKDGKPRPPPALFTYRPSGTSAHGPAVSSFVVGFTAGYEVTYAWDTKSRSWNRTIFGAPDRTANGTLISPKNVIVMTVHYVGGVGVIDSYAQLVGSGPVTVFTDGVLQRGTWHRANLHVRTVYRNDQGQVIELSPGQTWVELLDVSQHLSITTDK